MDNLSSFAYINILLIYLSIWSALFDNWLPVPHVWLTTKLKSKHACFQGFANQWPAYLHSIWQVYSSGRTLRSSSQHLLTVPNVKTYLRCEITSPTPSATSFVLLDYHPPSNVATFKYHLKTFLFDLYLAFGPLVTFIWCLCNQVCSEFVACKINLYCIVL